MITLDEIDDGLEIIEAEEIMAKIVNGELIAYKKICINGDIDIDQFRSDNDESFIIKSPIKIINSKIKGRINFSRTILKEQVNLSNTQFFEAVNFSNTEFCKKAFFYGSDFQRETSFLSAIFNDNTYFNGTHFKEDLLFTGSHFQKDLFFYGSVFNGSVFLNGSNFYGEADFRNVRFIHQALYSKSEFRGNCIFDDTIFRKEAWFSDCIFKSDIDFSETLFKENAYFQFTQFKNKAKFDGAQFDKDADFTSIHVFKWNNIFGADEGTLKEFLAKKFNIGWIKSAKLIKGNDGKTINASAGIDSISLKIDHKNGNMSLKINDSQLKEHIAEVGPDKQTIYGKVDSCFENSSSFIGTNIRGDVDFSGRQFLGTAYFSESNFHNNAFFRDSTFKGDAIFNGCKISNIIYFDRSYFDAKFTLDGSIISTISLNGANMGPRSILLMNHVDIQRLLVKWEQIRDHLDYSNLMPKAELDELLSATYLFLIKNFRSLEYCDDERVCSEYYESSIKNNVDGLIKIGAKEILKTISKSDAVKCEKCYISGDLEIKNALQKHGKFYVIRSPIKIGKSKISENVDFNNTIFEGPVILIDNEFQGTISFNNSIFEGPVILAHNKFQETVNFNNAIFEKPAILANNSFADYAMFNGIRFKENVQFCQSKFLKDVEFEGAHFCAKSYFNEAHFKRDVRFLESRFINNAYFIGAKFNGNAFFKESKFLGELDSRGVEFALDAYFNKARFCMDVEFFSSQFRGNAEFMSTYFKGDAGFEDVQFLGYANFEGAQLKNACFEKAKFEENAYFSKGTSFENANFAEAWFCKDADFSNSMFMKKARFFKSLLDGNAYFRKSRFFEDANFRRAKFSRNVNFVGSEFKRAIFIRSTFGGFVNFKGSVFSEIAHFQNSKFSENVLFKRSIFKCGAIFNECRVTSNILFHNVTIYKNFELDDFIGEAIHLDDATFENGSNFFFKNSIFSHLIVKWGDIKNHLDYSGRTDSKERTINIYFLLMRNYQNLGLFDEADSCSVLYKTAKKNSCANDIKPEGNEYWNGAKLAFSGFIDQRLYGYGVFPLNPIKSSVIVLIVFWIFFMIPGFAAQDVIGSILNGLYLSMIVFISNPTNERLEGIFAWAGIFERIIGWALMAAFLVVLARKTIR